MTQAQNGDHSPMLRLTSITGKLLLVLLPLVTLSMLLIFGLLELSFYRTQVASVENSLKGLLEMQAAAASNALWEVDDEQLEEVISNLAAYPSVDSVIVIDDRGRQRAMAGNATRDPKPSTLIGTRKLDHDGVPVGELRIELHLRDVTAQVIEHLPRDALVLLTVLLALVLGVLLASRRVIQRPLALLAEGIVKARQSTTSESIPWHSNDELGRVVHAFNELQVVRATAEAEVAYIEEHLRELIEIRTDELQRAVARAEDATRAKSDFLAAMSHEIRTPMNGILGMAQLLLMPNISESERQEYARTILNSGQTLLTLLNDILDHSKVEAGKLELLHAACDPRQIVSETAALFAGPAKSKGLSIQTVWRNLVERRYWADPIRLRQMLTNLVSNAVKFSSRGIVRMEVGEVERRNGKALLEFSVTDSGMGIAPEKQSLLFKPFSQTDSSINRDYGGTGLGLSIVSSLATLMGGEVGVESEAGKGSRFWFRIWAEILGDGQESRHVDREAGMERKTERLTEFSGHILVVEDNQTNRKVIEAVLGKLGIRTESVGNGQEAVSAIEGGANPDLLLMDVQMPVMDGMEATRAIRRWEERNARPRTTIIALTAGAFDEDRQRCLEAGMDDFLAKPVDIEELTATLGRWLTVAASRTASPRMAGTATPGGSPPVFDAEALLFQLGGDLELAKVISLSAMEDMSACFDRLEQAVVAAQWADAQRQTHTLKGLTAQVAGIKLCRRVQELDAKLKSGGETDGATVADLRNEYQVLVDVLEHWMASLATTTAMPPKEPVAAETIVAIYRDLEGLLRLNKFDALDRFKELEDALAGSGVSAEISEMRRLVAEFRFDRALEQLRRIATRLGWEDKPS